MWDEIAFSFLIFNGTAIEVYELRSNFISHFTGTCDYLSVQGLKWIHVIKGVPDNVISEHPR